MHARLLGAARCRPRGWRWGRRCTKSRTPMPSCEWRGSCCGLTSGRSEPSPNEFGLSLLIHGRAEHNARSTLGSLPTLQCAVRCVAMVRAVGSARGRGPGPARTAPPDDWRVSERFMTDDLPNQVSVTDSYQPGCMARMSVLVLKPCSRANTRSCPRGLCAGPVELL